MTPRLNEQKCAYPDELADLVEKASYRPGWEFHLEDIDRGQGSGGLTLKILPWEGYWPHWWKIFERGGKVACEPAEVDLQIVPDVSIG